MSQCFTHWKGLHKRKGYITISHLKSQPMYGI